METNQQEAVFTNDAFKHKDCSSQLKEGEVWVGNSDVTEGVKVDDYLKEMKTARLGEQAYDIKGKPLERWYCRPLIIHKSEAELYDKIMMARLKL